MLNVVSRGVCALLIGAIRAYQIAISPLLGRNCRFVPSCSEYAAQALKMHGAIRGTVLAAIRIMKCGPWHPGGVDPVPEDVSFAKMFRRR